jgi:ABC-2 type transport system permease protein
VAYVGLGFAFGARLARRTEDVTGLVAAVGVPLLVLGGTFFTTDMLPPFLHTLAQFDPIYHMNAAFRGVALGGSGPSEVASSIVFLGVMSPIALVLGGRSYYKMLDRERAD